MKFKAHNTKLHVRNAKSVTSLLPSKVCHFPTNNYTKISLVTSLFAEKKKLHKPSKILKTDTIYIKISSQTGMTNHKSPKYF